MNKPRLAFALSIAVVLAAAPAHSEPITWGSSAANVARAEAAIASGVNTKFLSAQCTGTAAPKDDCATTAVSEGELNRAYLVVAARKIYTTRLLVDFVRHPIATSAFILHAVTALVGVVFGSTRNPAEVSDPQDLYQPEEFQPWHEN